MAQYQVKKINSTKVLETKADPASAKLVADKLQVETGDTYEVYEVKPIYMTTAQVNAKIAFF